MRRARAVIALVVGVLGSAIGGTASAYALGYRLNLTSSVPIGLYRLGAAAAARGRIVAYCPADRPVFHMARERGYILGGLDCDGGFRPIFKPVAAVAGDVVMVAGEGIRVNGALLANSRARRHDRERRPLPTLPAGRHVVRPGEIWLVSSHSPGSFDSRYIGAVPAAGILGVVDPIMTMG